MADIRLAVVFGKLFGGEDELAIGLDVVWISSLLVKGVDHQGSVDLDRLLLFLVVEHQATAETAGGRAVGPIEHRIRPNGHRLIRYTRLIFRAERP